MPLKVTELFGFPPGAEKFQAAVQSRKCPFIGSACRKNFSDGMPSGLCSASSSKNPMPVICCPQRLYANDYEILHRVSAAAFGESAVLLTKLANGLPSSGGVIPFGQRMGKELKVQSRGTSYAFDWILASLNGNGELIEFVAVEVQTIDTTGSYRRQSWELQVRTGAEGMGKFAEPAKGKSSNFNFENVSKRILPQLITKGHLLRVEELCRKGLFFICPTPVLSRIYTRLGNHLAEYSLQPGSITFHDYTLDMTSQEHPLPLKFGSSFTTTHDQLAMAFSSPQNLPPKNSYSQVVRDAVRERLDGI
jgi:Restriction endonuclease NotI